MKSPACFAAVILLCCLVFSAGCIGDQTTDLKIGNESIGKITITPIYDQIFTNSSLDEKFNVRIEVFGLVFTKSGVSRAEADEIVSNLTDNDGELSYDFLSSSGLVRESSEDASQNLQEFMDEVFNMPITNKDPDRKITDIEWTKAVSRMQDSVNRTLELLHV